MNAMITATCAICGQKMQGQSESEWPDWPFCSRRCRLVDLGRWLGEEYRVPTQPMPAQTEDEDED